MDRAYLEEHLTQAEEIVSQGAQHIARQKTLVARLESAGYDASSARDLLRVFELLQISHIEHRDRLRRDLGVRDPFVKD
jgi:hypothetical protein